MSIVRRIAEEIEPFFQYATIENPSRVVRIDISSEGELKLCKIYANCISCNQKRFEHAELFDPPVGTDMFFCDPCYKKVVGIVKKYETFLAEEKVLFEKIWDGFAVPPLRIGARL